MKTKKHLIITVTTLTAMAALCVLPSCTNGATGTHEMGPPGKGRTMSDADMPSRQGR
jgi:hypothetical protein